MRTRRRVPPMLTRGIIRSVWFAKAAPSAGAGAAVQVPIQCEVSIGMRLLGGGLYSLTLRTVVLVGVRHRRRTLAHARARETLTEVQNGNSQADLRRFPRERADRPVGRAHGQEVS